MKRLIKFRGWDKRMFENVIPDGDSWCTSLIEDNWHSGPVMQFTGLTDKNGKEIYEGDILNTEDSGLARPGGVLAVKYSGAAFVIYSPSCCEVCKKGNGCISNLDEWRADKYIVIGNIYENPELLCPS